MGQLVQLVGRCRVSSTPSNSQESPNHLSVCLPSQTNLFFSIHHRRFTPRHVLFLFCCPAGPRLRALKVSTQQCCSAASCLPPYAVKCTVLLSICGLLQFLHERLLGVLVPRLPCTDVPNPGQSSLSYIHPSSRERSEGFGFELNRCADSA